MSYSLEPPRPGGSNEYPQSMFWAEIWKILEVLSENFHFFFVVKFSVYSNRFVFVMAFLPQNGYFLVSPWKHMLWVLIRSPQLRRFKWIPKQMFSWRNKKKYIYLVTSLIESYMYIINGILVYNTGIIYLELSSWRHALQSNNYYQIRVK